MSKEVKISEKTLHSLEESSAYTGIGINKIRELSNKKNCEFVLFVGRKRLIKRKKFDEFLEKSYSI